MRLCLSYRYSSEVALMRLIFMPGGTDMEFLIDRKDLPYDAFVNDPSWLILIEEGGGADGDAETEKVQTDEVQSEGQPL